MRYRTKIKNLGKVITGTTPPTKKLELFGGRHLFIKPSDFSPSQRYIFDTEMTLSDKGFEYQKSKLLPRDTVCVVCIGTLGKLCLTSEPSFTNQQLNSIVVNKDNNAKYVFYLMHYYMPHIKKLEGGSASGREHVNKTNFENMELGVHLLKEQNKIASILSAYDDLIENNSKRINRLERIAELLYKEWFVNFRFPGHEDSKFVESELGLIPEGWEVKSMSDFGKVVTGKTPSTSKPEYFGVEIPFIKTPDMHGNMFCTSVNDYLSKLGADSQSNKYLPPNSLLVNCIGALAGSVSINPIAAQTNQQINALILNSQLFREYMYFALVNLRDEIRLQGSAGATMINLSKGKFENLRVLSPSSLVLETYSKAAQPQFELIKCLQLKNQNLRQTRDMLLPKLISGELDVSDLEVQTLTSN